jgi:hypothetical protein
MSSFIGKLVRKKYVDLSTVTDTKLARCLNTFDLTALGKLRLKVYRIRSKW